MRNWLFVLLVACGGPAASTQPTISNQPGPGTPPMVAQTPPANPKPACGDETTAKCAISHMEYFTNQMCTCKDKACADGANDAMIKWGTRMAEKASKAPNHEKPDPEIAKQSADLMTRYTECMTKLMIGTPPPADPCGGDPCGG
jgi:hypothetical protein